MSEMRNTYTATCYRCGLVVPAGTGHAEPFEARHKEMWPGIPSLAQPRWLVEHGTCKIKYAGTDTHYRWKPTHENA
jgi:hypothetical protein